MHVDGKNNFQHAPHDTGSSIIKDIAYIFSNIVGLPGPNGQVTYCYHFALVIVVSSLDLVL